MQTQIHQTGLWQLANQTVCRTLQMRCRCSALVSLPGGAPPKISPCGHVHVHVGPLWDLAWFSGV